MPAFSMTVGDSVSHDLIVTPPDGVLDAVPAWSSSDEAVVVVTPTSNGLHAAFTAVGAGSATISVTDTSLGNALKATADVTVAPVPPPPPVPVTSLEIA